MNKYSVFLIALIISSSLEGQSSIIYTKHNLSVSGPGDIKSDQTQEICVFCHAPHNTGAQTPLWNHELSTITYTLYGSATMTSHTIQPATKSRLCLSCHDGTVALGMVSSKPDPIPFPPGLDVIPSDRRSNLSSNLADDHPLTLDFNPHPSGELACTGCHQVHNMTFNNLECTSCHDPHDNTNPPFLKFGLIRGELCNRCHSLRYWSVSAHYSSDASWDGTPPNPWPDISFTTVGQTACYDCHTAHGAGSGSWLLVYPAEEDNCFKCHNGHVATKNVMTVFQKTSVHSVTSYQYMHSPNEDPLTMTPHVECTDCHNPHQVQTMTTAPSPPELPPGLKGVSGLDASGNPVNSVTYEYEVCLKCHQYPLPGQQEYVPRVVEQNSIRLEFSTSNPSYHPVFGAGRNSQVPSLLSPYTTGSLIYCSSCHNNDDMSADAIRGPHGSNYAPILIANLVMEDYHQESPSTYALCYRCHDENRILQDNSRFPHREHVRGAKAACTTCHDPHGSYNYTHLINFNSNYVQPSSQQHRLEFIDDGNFAGTCYLKCHNKNHEPKSYH